MRSTSVIINIVLMTFALGYGSSRHLQRQRKANIRNCVSKFYNREFGPLEILMLPLGEKLWLRAWLGNHMTNLLHMEGVDLAEVTHLATEHTRLKRSYFERNRGDHVQCYTCLPRYVIPSSYRLMLQPILQQGVFQGRVQINITCVQPTYKIVLHAHRELLISRTAISVRRMGPKPSSTTDTFDLGNHYERFPDNYLPVVKVSRDMKTSHCEILLSEALTEGVTYQLDIPFSGQLSNKKQDAFYHILNENNTMDMGWFIATSMKDGSARRVFPCFDESSFKATFEVSITRPINMKTISTMPLRTSETMDDDAGWVWDHFQITPPMLASSLGIFIFDPRNMFPVSPTVIQGGVSVQGFAQTAHLSEAQVMVNYLAVGINYLERYLGVAFPLPLLNIVILPDVFDHSEDYWGLLITGSSFQPSVQLLQQWFGHLVTPADMVSKNLTTGLAHYHAYICPMEVTEKCESDDGQAWGLRYTYTTHNDASDKPNPQQFQLRKMIWLFRMLNYTLTERIFRKGIQTFLKDRAYTTFKDEDLWNVLDVEAWTYDTLEQNISTKQIAESWIDKDHFPVITITRNYDSNTALVMQEVYVRRWPYSVSRQKNMLWWIPIMYLTQDNLDVHNISFITWMREERNISIEHMPNPNLFVIINPEDIGMFIVNYDTTNWNMLAEYLITSAVHKEQPLIQPATRAKLLHNAWYLALAGRLDFGTALNITLFLKRETDITVWKTLAQVYFTVSWKLAGTEAEFKFDRFIAELLMHMYIKEEDENLQEYQDTAEIHALAHYVLCKAGNKVAVERARTEFSKWMDEQREISDGTLWGVFRWVDEDWERGLQRVLDFVLNDTSSHFKGFLLSQLASGTTQPYKLKRLLNILLLEEDFKFSDEEIKEVSAAITNCTTFLEFISDHWDAIKKRFEDEVGVWQYILEQATRKFKTQEGYNMVLGVYAAHEIEEGIANIMEHSLHIIQVNKEGIYKNLPLLEDWVDNYLEQTETAHLSYLPEPTFSN